MISFKGCILNKKSMKIVFMYNKTTTKYTI